MLVNLTNNNYNRYRELYYSLLIKYDINIPTDYEFVFDEFLEHLINDTYHIITKNAKNHLNLYYYTENTFNQVFKFHIYSSEWKDKIFHCETNIELKRIIRLKKLNKIIKIL